MAKRGPVRTPTAILQQRGSWLANRNPDEPTPIGKAKMPSWLSDEAKKVWKSIAPTMRDAGILTSADGLMFAVFCDAFAQWQKAVEVSNKQPHIIAIRDKDGKIESYMELPHLRVYHRFVDHLIKLSAEFGLTPSARSRIIANVSEKSKDEAVKIESKFFGKSG